MVKRINWKRIYKSLEHFFDRCGGTLEKVVQGAFIIGALMGPVALLTRFSELMQNICEFIATICFGVVIMFLGLYSIGFMVTVIIRFVFAIIMGIFTVCKWTFESCFGGK